MDERTFSYVSRLVEITNENGDDRELVEKFLSTLREEFVFDNVAAYIHDTDTDSLDIIYARAVGRAKNAEADAAWGETIAHQVMAAKKIMVQTPDVISETDDRLKQAYLLGIPLRISNGDVKGALVFVRFGGPAYKDAHIEFASLGANLLSVLFERRSWKKMYAELNELKQQMQMQDDFVSTISHELRTPLGFIKGYSTSLLREDTSWDTDTQKEFLMIIDEEADRLSLLIENVLESARLQSKTLPLRFQPLRLDAVLRDVSTRIRARYKELDVNLDLQSSTTIHADGVRIAQVFDNLFTNAVKYAPDSPIHVELRQVGSSLIVVFTDQGPGIPPDSLPLIFDRFYRVRSDKNTGTGLGLYICRQIIDAHRGKIWAESNPGQGTTFFIELPIQEQ